MSYSSLTWSETKKMPSERQAQSGSSNSSNSSCPTLSVDRDVPQAKRLNNWNRNTNSWKKTVVESPVVKLKCDHYDDKHGTLGVSRVQKETRMRKPTARGAKQAARTRTPPGQECGDETETRGHTNNKHSETHHLSPIPKDPCMEYLPTLGLF